MIYHIDVASMYPNIILTNRLQPTAVVDSKTCSNCVFNEIENNCKKQLGWDYRVSYYPFTRNEYENLKIGTHRKDLKQKLKNFSQKNYKCQTKTEVEFREDIVCMRENPFYVDTIRDFRDLRYKYKNLASYHSRMKREAGVDQQKHSVLAVYFESL